MKTKNSALKKAASAAMLLALLTSVDGFAKTRVQPNEARTAAKKTTRVVTKRTVKRIKKSPLKPDQAESDFVDLSGKPVSSEPVQAKTDLKSSATSDATPTLATTVPAKSKRLGLKSANWRMGLIGETYANDMEQAQMNTLAVRGNMEYGLLKGMSLYADMQVALQKGYVQTQFGDTTPMSGVSVKEAAVKLQPAEWVGAKAGVLNQSGFGNSAIVDYIAFPGVAEKIEFGPKVFKTALIAQQLIPTSQTTDTQATEAEVTPMFTTETLKLSTTPVEAFTAEVFGSHYRFSSLPSKVAADSKRFGNEMVEVTAEKSRFKYDFDGFVAGAGTSWQMFSALKWELGGKMIQNLAAEEKGRGQQYSTTFTISLPGAIDIAPGAEAFMLESNVSPGAYNDAELGHTNRVGWAADLALIFKEAGFKIAGRYVTSEPIEANSNQMAQTYFMLKLETLYDSLL